MKMHFDQDVRRAQMYGMKIWGVNVMYQTKRSTEAYGMHGKQFLNEIVAELGIERAFGLTEHLTSLTGFVEDFTITSDLGKNGYFTLNDANGRHICRFLSVLHTLALGPAVNRGLPCTCEGIEIEGVFYAMKIQLVEDMPQ